MDVRRSSVLAHEAYDLRGTSIATTQSMQFTYFLGPGQRPFHPCPERFSISTDTLEVGLRFPLHPIIEECLGWVKVVTTSPLGQHELDARQSQSRRGMLGYHLFNSNCGPDASTMCRVLFTIRGAGDPCRRGNKEAVIRSERSARAKDKGPAGPTEETLTPSPKPRSVRELCSTRPGVDDRDYHAIRMSSLPKRAPDAPLEMDLTPLTYREGIWLDGEASTKYIRATQIPKLASDLYTLSSKVLMDGAVKAMVLDALQADLPRQAIEDNKKYFRFEMGLVRMGWVSLEYGYQLVLVWLRARHPGVEIEEDPFTLLPEDASVPMADEQLFNDSPPPPEE
ncbi:hypothetical protein B296_00005907 [Ensete ventricosum]|uniref:Uncharacterized protein n=1 Tax=Ensete ventricosum TaxID=4639 RepID=A0A427AI03_ENSVE|nr:hypothetical protein B296_00005907 [Ensete ventricosum]